MRVHPCWLTNGSLAQMVNGSPSITFKSILPVPHNKTYLLQWESILVDSQMVLLPKWWMLLLLLPSNPHYLSPITRLTCCNESPSLLTHKWFSSPNGECLSFCCLQILTTCPHNKTYLLQWESILVDSQMVLLPKWWMPLLLLPSNPHYLSPITRLTCCNESPSLLTHKWFSSPNGECFSFCCLQILTTCPP